MLYLVEGITDSVWHMPRTRTGTDAVENTRASSATTAGPGGRAGRKSALLHCTPCCSTNAAMRTRMSYQRATRRKLGQHMRLGSAAHLDLSRPHCCLHSPPARSSCRIVFLTHFRISPASPAWMYIFLQDCWWQDLTLASRGLAPATTASTRRRPEPGV